MDLGIGTSHLGQSNDINWTNYFFSAHELGYCYIDTSPFYSSASAERTIGKFLDANLGYKIITKFGLPYNDLNSVYGKISMRAKKKINPKNIWGYQLSPKLISRELTRSLTRLKVNDCFGYLMHSVDNSVQFDAWVENLVAVKKAGLVQNIGLSIDSQIDSDFSWADILQIPASLSIWAETLNFKGIVMINSFARDDATQLESRVLLAKKLFPEGIGLIRSSSVDHLRYFANLIQGN